MGIRFPETLFVAGTDTEVGKTVVAAMLAVGLGAAYWKPVQSGASAGTDTAWIKEKTGLPDSFFYPEAYVLDAFVSPHAAAVRQGVRIDLENIRMPRRREAAHLIIEGAGGIMVPLNDTETMADLILRLEAPVLLVARSGLGTINHTLLSLEKLNALGVPVLGVAMNGPRNSGNRAAIEHFGNIPVVAEVAPMAEISFKTLLKTFNACFHRDMGGRAPHLSAGRGPDERVI